MNSQNNQFISPSANNTARKIGLVSRDYNTLYHNGYRDFSYALPAVLQTLDEEGCDTALFSLYSIIPRKGYDVLDVLGDYANLKMVCLEEFKDFKKGRKAGDYVVYYRLPHGWEEYRFRQIFGTINWQTQGEMLRKFVDEELANRVIGNTTILVCGESNGVKYDKAGSKTIIDPYGLVAAIPDNVQIIFNPLHDRMSRFEMVMKRRFLSQRGRWVLSVWNKGNQDKHGKTRDGVQPPWTIFYNGRAVKPTMVPNNFDLYIAYLVANPPH